MKFCAECGAKAAKADRFCSNCGNPHGLPPPAPGSNKTESLGPPSQSWSKATGRSPESTQLLLTAPASTAPAIQSSVVGSSGSSTHKSNLQVALRPGSNNLQVALQPGSPRADVLAARMEAPPERNSALTVAPNKSAGVHGGAAAGGRVATKPHAAVPASIGKFIPTKEWQEVPEGVGVPPGLEIRMDLASGKNFARLMR